MLAKSVFQDTFDRVVVINLDRRPDRMSTVRTQLAKLGVAYERHPASDGKSPEIAADWRKYQARMRSVSDGFRPVADWRDFYLGDKPHEERVAFFNKERGLPIATAGAWALFRSMRRVIEKAAIAKVESLLILEDDVRFHRDTVDLWPKISAELPKDWQVLQLGAMQLHWEDNWIKWHAQHLYRCQGSSLAAHAVALKRDAMLAILARSKVPDLPFDIGPLQEAKRLFRDRCFTVYPNIAIQDTTDSEIGMSKLFFEQAKKNNNIYRWKWQDYAPEALRPVATYKPERRPCKFPPATLQPYAAKPGSVPRAIVIFGPADTTEADAFIQLLSTQKEEGEVAPIVLLDDMTYVPALRAAGLAFEYVPSPTVYASGLPSGRDPELVIARRLSILRRKWAPMRILALGAAAQPRLAAWRASPFEANVMGSDLAAGGDLLGVSV